MRCGREEGLFYIFTLKMGVQIVILLFELAMSSLATSATALFIISALNVYNIVSALYTAFYSLGFLAYLFVLIANTPYLFTLLRLLCSRKSEFRRRALYRVSQQLYLM